MLGDEEFLEGSVFNVQDRRVGTQLNADHVLGVTTLNVYSTLDFQTSGGEVEINSVVYTYNTMDEDAGTLTLSSGLVAAAAEDDDVWLSPPSWEKVAQVRFSDREDSEWCIVPHALQDAFEEGIRDPGTEERVSVSLENGDWVIQNKINEMLRRSGTYLDPTTVPSPEPVEKPQVSPPVNVIGYAEGLIVQSGPINPTDSVEYHLSTIDGFTPTPGDVATLAVSATKDQLVIITQLPNSAGPLNLDTTYYVKALAVNSVGYADNAGTQGSAELDPTRVASIVSAEIAAAKVTAGKVVVANSYWDSTGLYLVTAGGTISFPTNGTAAQITAELIAFSLTVSGLSTFQGEVIFQDTVTLGSGVLAPSDVATVIGSHPYVAATVDDSDPAFPENQRPSNWYGLCDDGVGSWLTVCRGRTTNYLARINRSTGVVDYPTVPALGGGSGYQAWAAARVGTTLYVLAYTGSAFQVIPLNTTTFAVQAGSFAVTPGYTGTGTDMHLISDGSGLAFVNFAWENFDKPLVAFKHYSTAGVSGTTYISSLGGGLQGVHSTFMGNGPFGSYRYGQFQRVGQSPSNNVRVWERPGSGTRLVITSENWVPHISTSNSTPGVYYDSTEGRYYALDRGTGAIYLYSKNGLDQAARSVAHRLTDGTGATALSPVVSHSQKKRAWIRVEVPPYPSTPSGLYGQVVIDTRIQTPLVALSPANREAWIDTWNAGGPVAAPAAFSSVPVSDFRTAKENGGIPVVQIKGDGDSQLGPWKIDTAARNVDRVKIRLTVDQNILNNDWVYMGSATAVFDGDSLHSNVSFTSRLTIKRTGLYMVVGSARFETNATGYRGVSIKRNQGVSADIAVAYGPAFSGQNTTITATALVELDEDDIIQLQVYQNSGGVLDVRGVSDNYTRLELVRVG